MDDELRTALALLPPIQCEALHTQAEFKLELRSRLSHPPYKMRLDTVGIIARELGRLYRAGLSGRVNTAEAASLAFILKELRGALESEREAAVINMPVGSFGDLIVLSVPPDRISARGRLRRPPPDHSITSSAATSNLSGTVSPSAFAVLRLMTSSNLVGACTGRSPGFAPLRIRSTYSAASRYNSIAWMP